ncbi:hypothetical protein I9A72_07495, partial [Campylobacter jejuni]|nr:hypothetical protein [Campylobacter jejuni]
MILLEKVLDERKRQKQEKENDNANNTRSNSTGIVRENDKTEPREISQSSSLSDPERNGGYSTMATLGHLAITCKQLDLKENYQKVLVEIQMNLETQHKADLAEQRA